MGQNPIDIMTKKETEILIHKYNEGNCTPEEKQLVEKYFLTYLENSKEIPDWLRMEADQAEMYETIQAHLLKTSDLSKVKTLWPRIAVAAAVCAIIFSVGLRYVNHQKAKIQATAYVNDVAPGKEGATLTLADGKKILIHEALSGSIANQSGVKVSKTKDGQIVYEVVDQKDGEGGYNTLSTANGEQISVRLPDGTLVFLNAATTLKYPVSFAKMKKREVSISGEGYFEVFKDRKHPFVVKTVSQEIEVLGTHFNVNAYGDEPSVKTTLLEGSVKINSGPDSEILQPNQQAILIGNKITVKEVDIEEIMAWKNNEFLFKNDDFKTNMRKIARWYNVEMIYEDDAPIHFKLGGFSSRERNLTTILKLLEETGKVHFRIEGNKVYVSK
ncbi:FecR family protein [Sphingobacterium lumbrici]|uniref:FecR family protein n=1 Tax=Sphingobacterium lumbrici TaxID=2559600 RepID=UPI001128845E|nr:FecR family protein [Sphingobacterium lumbrici]